MTGMSPARGTPPAPSTLDDIARLSSQADTPLLPWQTKVLASYLTADGNLHASVPFRSGRRALYLAADGAALYMADDGAPSPQLVEGGRRGLAASMVVLDEVPRYIADGA